MASSSSSWHCLLIVVSGSFLIGQCVPMLRHFRCALASRLHHRLQKPSWTFKAIIQKMVRLGHHKNKEKKRVLKPDLNFNILLSYLLLKAPSWSCWVFFSSSSHEADCHFKQEEHFCRCVSAYLPQWEAEGAGVWRAHAITPRLTAEGECLWNKHRLMWGSQLCTAVALEASCIIPTSLSSLGFYSPSLWRRAHADTLAVFPRGADSKVPWGSNGVKQTVNQLQGAISPKVEARDWTELRRPNIQPPPNENTHASGTAAT